MTIEELYDLLQEYKSLLQIRDEKQKAVGRLAVSKSVSKVSKDFCVQLQRDLIEVDKLIEKIGGTGISV
jgi:hypothetical protein